MTDDRGVPLTASLFPANRHDSQTMVSLIRNFPKLPGAVGRPRELPDSITADKAYDSRSIRELLSWLGIKPNIERRGQQSNGLGKKRWAIERTISWLKQFRRIRIRWEREHKNFFHMITLAMAVICYRMLKT